MEEEKNKKKNNKRKKKNNKQQLNKTSENVAAGSDEADSVAGSRDVDVKDDYDDKTFDLAGLRNGDAEQKRDDPLDKHRMNEIEGSVLAAEFEKQNWLNREVSLEETIKELKSEKELYIQKEASLNETIKQMQSDKELHIHKEAALEVQIGQLESEKESWLRKESSLEEEISQLLEEKALLSSKGASLEKRIKQLLEETASFGVEKANLDEKIKLLQSEQSSWLLQEKSTKEIIASLNDDNNKLQMQVMEVEETRNKYFHENQLLLENVNNLQSQIQALEITSSARSSTETTKIEASRSLIEKLVSENAELVEKLNELYYELDQQNGTYGLTSAVVSEPIVDNIEPATVADILPESKVEEFIPIVDNIEPATVADILPESKVEELVSAKVIDSSEAISIQNGMKDGNNLMSEYPTVTVNSSEISQTDEIVEIPVDEGEIQEVGSETALSDEQMPVPITDAPLIGAPFRFMSFVAHYVSGADLVNKR